MVIPRDNDRRPKGRDVKQARGASPPEWAEGIAHTEAAMTKTNNVVERLPCDHCGRDERQHTEIMGVGLMCHIQGNTFSNSKSTEIQSLSDRIAVLEGLLVKYGDRVRMATAWPESVQPAIDEAFDNERKRASLKGDK